MKLSSWGNFPVADANVQSPLNENELQKILSDQKSITLRGNGRTYGDASLGKEVISLLNFNKVIAFDEVNGILTCEAGILLNDILKIVVPKKWFLPVLPGTSFITVGGAIGSDVHGKNHHHVGTFSNFVISMQVLFADGKTETITSQSHPVLWSAICGGMGLVAIVTHATLKLKRITNSLVHCKQLIAPDISYLLSLMQKHVSREYSVAWLDVAKAKGKIGRGVLFVGDHSEDESSKLLEWKNLKIRNVPFYFPAFVLNKNSISVFNKLYYQKHNDGKIANENLTRFFNPLDSIRNWNRMYGKKGFLQYQLVVPLEKSEEALVRVIEKINARDMAAFLSTLKLMGAQQHLLSFPMKGFSLAMDFPFSKEALKLFNELDEIVMLYGGRLFLAKDARLSSENFKRMYPQHKMFLEIKNQFDPGNKFTSSMSERLFK